MARGEANSSDFVPVQAIIPEPAAGLGALLVMRDASFRLLIQAGAVNFDMKSPGERAGIVYAFGDLLDSLDPQTPIEIQQHSKQLDTGAYVRQFQPFLSGERLPAPLRALAAGHLDYYESTVKEQNLLQRQIYVIISSKGAGAPVMERPTDQVPFAHLWRALSKSSEKRSKWRAPSAQEITNARNDLTIRSDEMESRLRQIGVSTKRLDEAALRDILHEVFHPSLSERQSLGETGGLIAPIPRAARTPAATIRGELEAPRFRGQGEGS